MKRIRGKILLSILMLVGIVITVPDLAQALGTASNTTINNLATINYNVGGVGQTLIESSAAGNTVAGPGNGTATAFVVDNKIDLVVSTIDLAEVQVSPGSTGGTGVNVMIFRVDNTGNTVQDYSLAVTAVANAVGAGKFLGDVTFQATAPTIRVNSVKNVVGTYDSAVDLATYIDELAANDWVYVFVTANIPAGQVNGDIASHHLLAQTAVGGAAAAQGADIVADDSLVANTLGTVQTVFADGQGSDTANDGATPDGIYSSQDDYIVASAILTVSKTATTLYDPFNGNTNPKAIPGAYMQYTITVANAPGATANAELTTITDTLAATVLAIDPDLLLDDGATPESVAGSGFKVTYTGARTVPASPSYYTTLGADGILHDGSATGGVITATLTTLLAGDAIGDGELPPGASVSIIFNVIIQ